MAKGFKPAKLNKEFALIGLLFLCVLMLVLLLLGVFGGSAEEDTGVQPISATNPDSQEVERQDNQEERQGTEPANGSDQLIDPTGVQDSSVMDDLLGQNSQTATLEEDLMNSSQNSQAFTPSELKNLRDPFQSLLRKPQPSASSSTVAVGEPMGTQKPQTTVQPSSGQTKRNDRDVNTSGQQNSGQKNTDSETRVPPHEIQFPTFTLNGIVSQAGVEKAIFNTKSHSYIVGKGERVQEWLVEEITQKDVRVLNEEGQRFIMTFEGVTMDESKK